VDAIGLSPSHEVKREEEQEEVVKRGQVTLKCMPIAMSHLYFYSQKDLHLYSHVRKF
jgi:hypothetical protein